MSYLSYLAVLVLGLEVFSASIPVIGPEENIKINLVGYESDAVEGLTPPARDALNYYNLESPRTEPESPYVVEITRKYLKIKTSGFPAQKIKLTEPETEGIQKLSLAVVEILNSSKLASGASGEEVAAPDATELNPVIILTNSGISLRFLNSSETDPTATETADEHRQILWDFLTKYARNIFEAKLKELKLNNKFAEEVEAPGNQASSFENFMRLLLRIVTFSIEYAETAFEGWTAPRAAVPAETEKRTGPTTANLFAFEEPSPFHEFPSDEFQFRRKDIDSIFYGRGVV